MSRIVQIVLGKTRRERVNTCLCWVLGITVVVLGVSLKWAMKSPTPAEWNYYSEEANDHLYRRTSTAVPQVSPIIAHRGGSVPDNPQAGPLARLNYSYDRGHRLFELDFCWTADEEVVVKHDWKRVPKIPTLEEFMRDEEGGASLAMLYSWMESHPDAYIITDCKKQSLRFFAKVRMERPELVPQFVPQIYQLKDYDLAQSQGFRHIILTLYRCLEFTSDDTIVEFAQEHDLFAVTMPTARCCETTLAERLKQQGVPVYAHTINHERLAAKVQACGGYGVYSDSLMLDEVEEIAWKPGRQLR